MEACAGEASRHASLPEVGWIVFHVSKAVGPLGDAQCVVQRCTERCKTSLSTSPPLQSDALRSFAPKELCPEGSAVILPEVGALGQEDGLLSPETAKLEFPRLFGPLQLRNQVLHSVRAECVENAHRVVASVCLPDGCDEWSKYSMPRCHVSLGRVASKALSSNLKS